MASFDHATSQQQAPILPEIDSMVDRICTATYGGPIFRSLINNYFLELASAHRGALAMYLYPELSHQVGKGKEGYEKTPIACICDLTNILPQLELILADARRQSLALAAARMEIISHRHSYRE